MASNPSPRNPIGPTRSPIGSAFVLLALYVAMYLAVAAVLHAIDPTVFDTPRSATATAPVASTVVPETPRDDDMLSDDDAPRQLRTDPAPDCKPGAAFDLRCHAD